MSQSLNVAPYSAALDSLTGGRRRRRQKRGMSKNRRISHSQNRQMTRNQRGGLFPGLGGIVQQALVPFGLYALQHSFKNRSRGRINSNGSGRVKFLRRTSRRS